jgi:hypothetical protein
MWCHKGDCATLRGKISKKYLKSLKKHEIKRKFICFTYKIEIYISFVNTSYYIFTRGYATREDIASGVHSVKLYFNLTCKTNKYPLCNINYFYFFFFITYAYYIFRYYIFDRFRKSLKQYVACFRLPTSRTNYYHECAYSKQSEPSSGIIS